MPTALGRFGTYILSSAIQTRSIAYHQIADKPLPQLCCCLFGSKNASTHRGDCRSIAKSLRHRQFGGTQSISLQTAGLTQPEQKSQVDCRPAIKHAPHNRPIGFRGRWLLTQDETDTPESSISPLGQVPVYINSRNTL